MDNLTNYKCIHLQHDLVREKECNRLREAFIRDYPISRIPSLSLDEYLYAPEGKGNPKSFCRRLQLELKMLASMGDARTNAFGIYNKGGSQIKLSRTFELMFDDDIDKAFTYIKQEISNLLIAADADDNKKIEECPLNNIFKYKLIITYYPEKYLPVCARETLKGYSEVAGISYDPKQEMVYQLLELVKVKENFQEFKSWSNWLFMRGLDYTWREWHGRRISSQTSYKERIDTSSFTTRDAILDAVAAVFKEHEKTAGYTFNRGISSVSCTYPGENVCIDIYTRTSRTGEDSAEERGPKIKITIKNHLKSPEYEAFKTLPKSSYLHDSYIPKEQGYVFYVPMEYYRDVLDVLCLARTKKESPLAQELKELKDQESTFERYLEEHHVKGEDREILTKQRVNQGFFREALLRIKPRKKCVLCEVSAQSLLIASHIKPWAVSDGEEKVDPDNGFLMCPNHDKLFDLGFISFDDEGNILVSEELSETDRTFMFVNPEAQVPLTEGNRKYLKYHRESIFKG